MKDIAKARELAEELEVLWPGQWVVCPIGEDTSAVVEDHPDGPECGLPITGDLENKVAEYLALVQPDELIDLLDDLVIADRSERDTRKKLREAIRERKAIWARYKQLAELINTHFGAYNDDELSEKTHRQIEDLIREDLGVKP